MSERDKGAGWGNVIGRLLMCSVLGTTFGIAMRSAEQIHDLRADVAEIKKALNIPEEPEKDETK